MQLQHTVHTVQFSTVHSTFVVGIYVLSEKDRHHKLNRYDYYGNKTKQTIAVQYKSIMLKQDQRFSWCNNLVEL